jgi:molecular chaperone HscA
MKAGYPRVEVTFNIDADGLVSISALEKVTNTRQSIDIRPTYGIDKADVMKMLEDSYIHAAEDHVERLLRETIIDATLEINNMKAALIETPDIINIDETDRIVKAISILEQAVNIRNRDGILEAIERMKATSEKFVAERMNFIIGKSLEGKAVSSIK